MLDTVQIVLLIVVVIITTLLVSLGLQIFFLIKEIRLGVQKVHSLLDRVTHLGDSVTGSIGSLVKGTSLVTVIKVVKLLLGHDKKTHDNK